MPWFVSPIRRQHPGGAVEIAHLIRERGWKKILLVTSNYHARRSRYIVERVLPPGSGLLVVSAPDTDLIPTAGGRATRPVPSSSMSSADPRRVVGNRHANAATSVILAPGAAAG